MANEQMKEMISAFSAGCMDRENFIQFKEFVKGGGSVPHREMGELQNTMALIPIILDLEKPKPETKAKVAQKLLTFQNEIKEKIKEQRKRERKTQIPLTKQQSAALNSGEFPELKPNITEEIVSTRVPTTSQTQKTSSTRVSGKTNTRTRESVIAPQKSKSYIGWIFAAVFFIALIIMYFIYDSSSASNKSEIESLTKDNESLKKDLVINKRIASNYKEIITFLKSKSIYAVDLDGNGLSKGASGKFLISFKTGDGLLILENPPELKEDEAFQIWMVSRGKSLSLGTIQKETGKKYYMLYNIPKLSLNQIDFFRITNEPIEGSIIPSGNTLLFGDIKNAN